MRLLVSENAIGTNRNVLNELPSEWRKGMSDRKRRNKGNW